MSEYGLLSEVVSEVRGSWLAAAASASDTELLVEYAGDFDPEGGTLDLNGARLEYTEIVDGVNPEDPDSLLLTAPLAVAADEGDTVSVVIAGQIAVDYVAHVGTDDGDQVSIPLRYDQLAGWPVDQYDPPVPVMFSEDHEHLEDAPGRPAMGRVLFCNTDAATAEGSGELVLALSHIPVAGSLHVRWNGVDLPASSWSLAGSTLTISDTDELFVEGDEFTTAYAYDGVATSTPIVPTGGTILAFEATGWKFKQVARTDATDYSAAAYDDSAWTTAPASFGAGGDMADGTGGAHVSGWAASTRMWARRTLTGMTVGADIAATIRVDRDVVIWLDGVEVYSASPNGIQTSTTISGAYVTSASMVLAVRATDESVSSGCFCDLELIQ